MAPVAIGRPDRSALWARELQTVTMNLGDFWRVSRKAHATVVYFGKGSLYRFDDPRAGFGVLYAGSDYMTCVSESVLRDDVRTGALPVYMADLECRAIARLAPAVVKLVDLTDGLGLGLDGQISTTPDYTITQDWASALYEHPDKPDGLYYTARTYTKGNAIALFDHAAGKTLEQPGTRVALREAPEYKDLLARLDRHGLALR